MRTAYCNLVLSQSEIISSKLSTKAIPEGLSPSLALNCSQKETRSKVSENPTSLPKVECAVRARIPTTTGSDLWLHLYKNDIDNKEHLAFLFGDQIKSRSLNRVRDGETELSRMVRGAYTGVLHPGRTSCRAASQLNQKQNVALQVKSNSPLVRVHSECYTGETAWSTRCDCGQQLDEAARMMMAAGSGVIIYLRQEGRGIGLGDKLKAYNLQDMGFDTVDANLLLGLPADARTYGIATAILKDLGLGNDSNTHGIRLLTNNPDKLQSIEGLHNEVTVKERVPITPVGWEASEHDQGNGSPELLQYLRTKVDKMGHLQPSGQVANKT